MSRSGWKMALQIAATYIGTVVGAGFASGQEVLQFFTGLGPGAIFAIFLATVLFFALGLFAMRLGRERALPTFGAAASALLGQRGGRAANILLLLLLFGVTVAMVAGSGALAAEVFRAPFAAGALLAALLAAATVLLGLRAIMVVNSIIVPCMLAFVTLTFAYSTASGLIRPALSAPLPAPMWWPPVRAAVTYAGFNVGLSLTVLVPLGHVPANRRTLAAGALLGACGLGVLLLLLHILLASSYGALRGWEVPLLFYARSLPLPLRAGFVLVLWAEIYSTLIANVYGLAEELSSLTGWPRGTLAVCLLTAAYAACQVGFARIVAVAYPIFGYAGLLILAALIVRSRRPLRL